MILSKMYQYRIFPLSKISACIMVLEHNDELMTMHDASSVAVIPF